MSKFIYGFFFFILSQHSFAKVMTSIENRKTQDKIEIHCESDQCESMEFILVKSSSHGETSLGQFSQEQYQKFISNYIRKDRVRGRDNFFMITQFLCKSFPWDDPEFLLVYFLLSPITVPVTVAAVGIDLAILPIGLGTFTVDVFDGNTGRRVKRSLKNEKALKLSDRKFEQLVHNLEKADK